MTPSRYRYIALKLLVAALFLLLLCPLYMYFSHDVEKLNSSYLHATIQDTSISFKFQKDKPQKWVSFKEISDYAKWAIVLSEDWGFYQHQGIDIEQMKLAFNDMVEVKRFRGASTITQQMVKNVFLYEDKTVWRKIHEIILAQKVEQVLTKNKILEVYLNVIEFGPGIFGIRNASYHYFQKHPSALNPRESAFLAMLLPSPKKYYISYKNKKLTKFARKRITAILIKMRMGKVLTPAQYQAQKISQLKWER
jgi:monofunctional biosynthetic peptidoglycan transglycosylase